MNIIVDLKKMLENLHDYSIELALNVRLKQRSTRTILMENCSNRLRF